MLDLKDTWTEYGETGSREVRERIIMDSLPLVKYVVGKVAHAAPTNCDREDLIQCGIFGLIDAVERYDPTKDVKFETYAILRIRGAVIDEMRSRDWVPRSKRKMAREVEAAKCDLKSRNGDVPTVDDLAEAMGVSQEEMQGRLEDTSFVTFVSLNEPRSHSGAGADVAGTSMADLLRDSSSDGPAGRIELEERVRSLSRAITELPEQERIIVTLYYYEEMRLKDIGELYGVSESRISQIHSRALVLLKVALAEKVA